MQQIESITKSPIDSKWELYVKSRDSCGRNAPY